MQVRCPFCQSPIELSDESSLSDIPCPVCGSSFSLIGEEETAAYEAGTKTIGHFELIEQIGFGSFGTVWKAKDTELDRTVAVKIPRKGQLEPSETEQFLREARAAAQIKHPNIVSVHEVGRDDDSVYIVSDFVEGVTLADRLTAQSFSAREAAELCARIAEALDHAHEAKVIHRDLKPANIILDADGSPHIMDFGLARREAGDVTMTVEGRMLGTPAYMSPEQAKGSAHTANRRSDIYSLGVVLFELLTGERPFRGSVRMLLHQVIHDEAPSPRKLTSSVPKDLETICLKCLEKDPDKRFSTAKGLAVELRRFLAGEAIKARPISKAARAWRWCKRNQVVACLATAFTVAVLAGLVGVSWQWGRAEDEAKRANDTAEEREEARLEAVAAKRTAEEEAEARRRLLYISDMNTAQQAWDHNNVGRTTRLLRGHYPGPEQSDLRHFEWFRLWRLCQRSQSTKTLEHVNSPKSLVFSPDGTILAAAGGNRGVKLWYLKDEYERSIMPSRFSHASALCYSPDGKILAIAGRERTGFVTLWHVDKNVEGLTRSDGMLPASSCLAFSPDSRTLAVSSWGTSIIHLWDVSTDFGRPLNGEALRSTRTIAFSPTGASLVSGDGDGWIKFWDPRSGELQSSIEAHPRDIMCLAFSRDGGMLASTAKDGLIKLWDTSTFDEIHTLTGHVGPVLNATFSLNGQTLFSGGQDNVVREWDVATGECIDILKGHNGQVGSIALNPDPSMAMLASASEDGQIKLWDLAKKRPQHVIADPDCDHMVVTFSPDDRILAVGDSTGAIRLWSVRTGEELGILPGQSSYHRINYLAFLPKGNALVFSTDNDVWTWDLKSATPSGPLGNVTGRVCSVLELEDRSRVILDTHEENVNVLDVSSGEAMPAFGPHKKNLALAAVSPKNDILATVGTNGKVTLWALRTHEVLCEFQSGVDRVNTLAFDSSSETLALGGIDGNIEIWNTTPPGLQAVSADHGGRVLALAFSPDSNRLASGAGDRTVRLWDVDTGEQAAMLTGHTDWVVSVAFSADGNTLASGSRDGTVRLWRAATKEEVEGPDVQKARLEDLQ